MKLNFTVEIDDFDEQLEYVIIEQVALKFYERVFKIYSDRDTLEKKIEKHIIDKIDNVIYNNEFKTSIIEELAKKIQNRIENTKQYKTIISEHDIESNRCIKQGLKNIVSEIVKSEIRKMIK